HRHGCGDDPGQGWSARRWGRLWLPLRLLRRLVRAPGGQSDGRSPPGEQIHLIAGLVDCPTLFVELLPTRALARLLRAVGRTCERENEAVRPTMGDEPPARQGACGRRACRGWKAAGTGPARCAIIATVHD